MRYRKKPIVIEAFLWTPGNASEPDPAWLVKAMNKPREEIGAVYIAEPGEFATVLTTSLLIYTLEGRMVAGPGDYIIQGVNGEIYPCKPDIFEKTYDAVQE